MRVITQEHPLNEPSTEISQGSCLALAGLESLGLKNRGPYIVFGEWMTDFAADLPSVEVFVPPAKGFREIQSIHKYVSQQYEFFLGQLIIVLNQQHGLQFSNRQWDIILGPWLKIYLDALYYRWDLLLSIYAQFKGEVLIQEAVKEPYQIPVSRAQFVSNFIQSKYWNQHILSSATCALQDRFPKIHVKTVVNTSSETPNIGSAGKTTSQRLKVQLKTLAKRLIQGLSFAASGEDTMIISTPYLSPADKYRLAQMLGKRKLVYFERLFICSKAPKPQRQCLETMIEQCSDDFSRFAAKQLIRYLPACYLEQWQQLNQQKKAIGLPKKVGLIYCGSSPDNDECLRLYIAEQISLNSKFIISQHGGIYGMSTVPLKGEYFEHRVTDAWISWGWQDATNPRIVPGPSIKLLHRDDSLKVPQGKELLVSLPALVPVPVRLINREPRQAIDAHKRFLCALDSELKPAVRVRPKPAHRRSPYTLEISEGFTQCKQTGLWDALKSCRLFVCTSYSTTMFEVLGVNIPTVLLLTGYESIFRKKSAAPLQQLAREGILYTDPQSAAEHINNIWLDVNAWWDQTQVQEARHAFCQQFYSTHEDGLVVLADSISSGMGLSAREPIDITATS
jgi:putative transferase (TIGR04331 family)